MPKHKKNPGQRVFDPQMMNAGSDGGQTALDAHVLDAAVASIPGQNPVDLQFSNAGSGGGQKAADIQKADAAVTSICEELRGLHRTRRYAMKLQQKIDRAMESYVRRSYTAWQPDMAEDERSKINRAVKSMIAQARDDVGPEDLVYVVKQTDATRKPSDDIRTKAEKRMEALAIQLPVYPWVKSIKGTGALGLATIVAEAGALDRYANVAKLWKRLGFAPYDGYAGSTWKRESWRPRALTSEEWVANPFSGERYALMNQIAKFLIMHQWKGAAKTESGKGEPTGHYGKVYGDRREHTAITHPDWTPMHSQNDAVRIAMKRFLADLWEQWNSGQSIIDAQHWRAGDGAADQKSDDAPKDDVGRAKPIRNSGQGTADAHGSRAGDGAADHFSIDAHRASVGRAKPIPGQTHGDAQANLAGSDAPGRP